MKNFFLILGASGLAIALLIGLWVLGGFVGLWWYPYQMKAQQQLITASPGYIQSKEQEISIFISAYDSTNSVRQKKGALQTICFDASQISVPLPQSQADFVTDHCH